MHFVPFCPAHCYYYCFTHVFIEQKNDDDDDDDSSTNATVQN